MILADTSAWIEFGRGTGSAADQRLLRLLAEGQPVVTTEPVLMELLAGCRDLNERHQVRRLLASVDWVPVDPMADFEAAAKVYSDCRAAGVTPRGLIDCMIAAIAMRSGSSLLAADRDFTAMAEVLPLRLA